MMMNVAALSPEWSVFTRISVLAVILCVIGAIVLVVPALFEYVRRWRANRRMDAEMQTVAKHSNPFNASPRADRLVNPVQAPTTPLGWSPEEDENKFDLPKEIKHGKRVSAENRDKTILVADDDPVVVHALSRRIEQLGYQVFRSPDASHALMGAMKVQPNLVILDVNMPGGNGLAVCEMMASDPRFAGIPVIIHSVITDEAAKERARQLGAHYVEKSPHSWSEIKTWIESLIGENAQPSTVEQTAQPLCCDKDAIQLPPKKTPSVQREASVADAVLELGKEDAPNPTDERPDPLPKTLESFPALDVPKKPSAASVAPSPIAHPSSSPMCGRSKILCIESPDDRLEYVDHQLSGLGMDVARTGDMDQGFWACFTEKPSAIVIQCGGDRKKLLALIQRLTDHPVTRIIPTLVIDEGNLLDEHEMLLNNNVILLKHPMDWENFLSELDKLLPMFGHEPEDPMSGFSPPSPAAGAADAQPPDSENRPSESAAAQLPVSVLCIDDDPIVAQSINIRLQHYGIKVDWACNGMQGYLAAVAQQPNLILLDLKMPNGEGDYVLTKLKDNEHTKDIPVVMLTVESNPGVKRKMITAGADAFLTKPVRWPELFDVMGRCIALPEQLLADYQITPQMTLSQL
jgi:DNA-binding response OmpR family regulator